MRIVGAGTPDKLWTPTAEQLLYKDWDNSFLQWVDLSGLTIPRMQDADVIHWKGTNTTFANTDWTQFRFPIDLSGAVIPSDLSSYNHDFVTEVSRRGMALPGLPGEVARADYEYLAQFYGRSWSDTYFNTMKVLKLTIEEAYQPSLEVFAGYTRCLGRLRYHYESGTVNVEPPNVETDLSAYKIHAVGGDVTLDLRNDVAFLQYDRTAGAEMLSQNVKAQVDASRLKFWIAQLHPYPVIKHIDQSTGIGGNTDQLKRSWR